MEETTEIPENIFIGMGGWDLPAFTKYFFPPDASKDFRKLEFYSRFFSCVEINATFYRSEFSADQARRWLADVSGNERFVFTVKLFRGFTHTRDATVKDVRDIEKFLEPLTAANKLGALVAQFPGSFAKTTEARKLIERIGKRFGGYPLFIELRHNSWDSPETLDFLREHRAKVVNVDLPPINRHMPLTAHAIGEQAYFRMMGRNASTWNAGGNFETPGKAENARYDYFYSEEELTRLIGLIGTMTQKVKRLFVVFHNDPNASSIINGFQFQKLIRPESKIIVPSRMLVTHPVLDQIADGVEA